MIILCGGCQNIEPIHHGCCLCQDAKTFELNMMAAWRSPSWDRGKRVWTPKKCFRHAFDVVKLWAKNFEFSSVQRRNAGFWLNAWTSSLDLPPKQLLFFVVVVLVAKNEINKNVWHVFATRSEMISTSNHLWHDLLWPLAQVVPLGPGYWLAMAIFAPLPVANLVCQIFDDGY